MRNVQNAFVTVKCALAFKLKRAFAGPTHLELGPLDAPDTAGRVPPRELGTERQLGLRQVVRAREVNVAPDGLPAGAVRRRVQPVHFLNILNTTQGE